MNWTQEMCAKFWKGVGAVENHETRMWFVNGTIVGSLLPIPAHIPVLIWKDPSSLPLETLLDILERLEPGAFFFRSATCERLDVLEYWVHKDVAHWDDTEGLLGRGATRKQAVIAAICQLIGLEVEE